jgi:hypothetical protein
MRGFECSMFNSEAAVFFAFVCSFDDLRSATTRLEASSAFAISALCSVYRALLFTSFEILVVHRTQAI